MHNISLLIGLKNNLEYTKYSYDIIRSVYPTLEVCYVSYGSTDGTDEWLDALEDVNVKYHYSAEQMTLSDTYNKAAEIATKDYVIHMHNDIIVAPGFIENIEKHINPKRLVSFTTIEPPIFAGHDRPGKIIKDFGADISTLKLEELYSYCKDIQTRYKDQLDLQGTIFGCISREVMLGIGGMDSLFSPMFCEDDDYLRRLRMHGIELVTALDSLTYHFVSKTSRFSEEYKAKTQLIEERSNKNYVRKWGSRSPAKKYDVGFVVESCNYELLSALEPWCSTIYLEDEMQVLTTHYLDAEQKNTKFNLNKKIKDLKHTTPNNDVIVKFNGKQLTNQSFQLLIQLPEIITESGEVGDFELDIFKISIYSMETYEHKLITNDNPYYINQLL